MVRHQNLFEMFRASEVDHGELTEILLHHFKTAIQQTDNEVLYPGHSTEYAVRLIYGRRGLKAIMPGPRLTDEDIKTIRRSVKEELLAPSGERVGSRILFAAVPVEGFCRYRDRFQIIPVPPDAPRPNVLMADHPFII